jgi:hypothetical protein
MVRSRTACVLLMFGVLVPFAILGKPAWGAAVEGMLSSWLDHVMQSVQTKRRPQKVIAIEDANLQTVFPGDRFYGIYFGRWPRPPAVSELPKELSIETVVRVRQGSSIEPIRSKEELRIFLAQNLSNVLGDSQARTAVLASLRLAEAGSQAGDSPFGQPNVSVIRQGNNVVATARAAVKEPSRGEVEVRLEFNADGKVNADAIKVEDGARSSPR